MATLGIVANVDATGVYVTMPGSRGLLRGPYLTVQNVAAGDRVLIVTTDGGEDVIVGLASAAAPRGTPATTVDNTVPRFDGTAGELQTSGITISDLNVLGGLADGAAATDAVTKSQLDGKLTIPGAWTTYNPSWGNVSMSATDADYCQIGKTVHFRCTGTLSDAPSGAVTVDMPVAMASSWAHGPVRLVRSASYQGVWFYSSASVALVRYLDDANSWQNLTATLPAAWASGDSITLTGTYEAA